MEESYITPINLYDFIISVQKIESLFYIKFNDMNYNGDEKIILRSNPYQPILQIIDKGKI